jgi:uncharacterized RDD family membrane protein YckC
MVPIIRANGETSSPERGGFDVEDLTHTVVYSGFWKRFGAFLIDAVIVSLVILILSAAMGFSVGIGGVGGPGATILGVLIALVAPWLYWAGMESSKHQATIGKMAFGMAVTDQFHNRISFARATARYYGKMLSSMTLLVGFIMAGFTQKKQALHDMLAGSVVVDAD